MKLDNVALLGSFVLTTDIAEKFVYHFPLGWRDEWSSPVFIGDQDTQRFLYVHSLHLSPEQILYMMEYNQELIQQKKKPVWFAFSFVQKATEKQTAYDVLPNVFHKPESFNP